MKGIKKMLLGFAFLFVALFGVIMRDTEFGMVLFCVGSVVGLILCVAGCFGKDIAQTFEKYRDVNGNIDEK